MNDWLIKWECEKETKECERLRLFYIDELCKLQNERKELLKNLQTLDYKIAKVSELIENL